MKTLIPSSVLPTEDYVVEADGEIKLKHADFTQALKAGLELKQKCPHIASKFMAQTSKHGRADEQSAA